MVEHKYEEEFVCSMRTHRAAAHGILISLLVFVGLSICFWYSGLRDKQVFAVLAIIGFVSNVQALQLHILYWFHDRNTILRYSQTTDYFSYSRENYKLEFSANNVIKIDWHVALTLAENRIPVYSSDSYNHAILTLSDQQEIKISCLVIEGNWRGVFEDKVVIHSSMFRTFE